MSVARFTTRQRRRALEGRLVGHIHYGLNGNHLFEIGFENYPASLVFGQQRLMDLKALIADFEAQAEADDARGLRTFERSERLK